MYVIKVNGALRKIAGFASMTLQENTGATTRQVLDELSSKSEDLHALLSSHSVKIIHNSKLLPSGELPEVSDGDVIVLTLPISGG